VVRLVVSDETILDRLERREAGSLRGWFLDRASGLAEELEAVGIEDFVVSNDGRAVREVASEILDRLGWIKI
jgi:chloramphenicol 3-O-phosphotransferase